MEQTTDMTSLVLVLMTVPLLGPLAVPVLLWLVF